MKGPQLLGKFCDFGVHYWGKHWAYWGTFPSSHTVKNALMKRFIEKINGVFEFIFILSLISPWFPTAKELVNSGPC